MLDVPLDYLHPKLGRAFVPIIKKPAATSHYKGILFLNPGGPSESGVQFLLNVPDDVKDAVGPDYDLASWEPRGIGYSVPAVNDCRTPGSTPESRFTNLKESYDDFKIRGPNIPIQEFIDHDRIRGIVQHGEDCARYMGGPLDAGPHMTTATVARDLISILDAYANSQDGRRAVQDPRMLNYWGFSYGSMIGQTFASMFPSRLGRIAVDGVVDPDLYVTADINAISTIDQDKVFSTFFVYCHHAGPVLCPFHTGNSPRDIYNLFESLFVALNFTHATRQGWENATEMMAVIQFLQSGIGRAVYDPVEYFPTIGTGLVVVDTLVKASNLSSSAVLEIFFAFSTPSSGDGRADPNPGFPPEDPAPMNSVNRFLGVVCSDTGGRLYNSSFEEYKKRFGVLQRQSWIGGTGVWKQYLSCLGWSIKSEDVFEGPFGGRTKGSFLVVGNTLDPVTPLVNAQKAKRVFQNAKLLTIEGAGHTSHTTRNICAFAKIKAFFNSDKWIGRDAYCPLEAGPWNITLRGPLEKGVELMLGRI
ncbi:hypothetical protein IFR05_012520 [Cadophora sp. M221]|nr:hypothetical protein IFR05_012520 [Cadophora sp. M221]